MIRKTILIKRHVHVMLSEVYYFYISHFILFACVNLSDNTVS